MKKKAIIDIGTNTFNLLVVQIESNNKLNVLYEEKLPVKLGKGSMQDGILKPDSMERAVVAINKHIDTSKKYKTENIDAFATSAVRSAKNKDVFLDKIKNECGIDIKIISGDEEALYIYNGIINAVKLQNNINYLILDIGGGSNEFILCNTNGILWKRSYDLGVARLLEKVNPHDPVTPDDIDKVHKITVSLIHELDENCKKFKPAVLIGASGSFETYSSIILHEKFGNDDLIKQNTWYEIMTEDFYKLHDKLIRSAVADRKKMKGLPVWRIDMIVLAAVFTEFILERYNLKKIIFSDYALKEGVAYGFSIVNG